MKRLVSFDWAIKKLLRNKANFGILEGFLSELLGQDLKIVKILESESNKESEDDKYNKVDILVELNTAEIVLVEVQVNNEHDYFHRMLFGTSKIITEYIKERQEYSSIKKVYSVNVLYFDLGHGSDYLYHGTTSFIGIHNHDVLDLSKKQKELYQKKCIKDIYPEYYLIKVNQFNDIAKNTLDEWIYFLKNEEIKDSFHAKGLLEAKEKLDSLKLPPEERQEYKRFLENIRYKLSMVESNFASGKIEGLKEGIEKGLEEGLKKGETKGKIEDAKKMKELGITKEMVQKITGLDTNEIDKIFVKSF
jgi:predicted transposase/invertase (TIGR01784 family)